MTSPTLIEVPGKGITDLSAMRISKAVENFDPNLRFGYNPANQDYMVYAIMPRTFDSFYTIDGEPVYPVVGFGYNIPSEDSVLDRLRKADVRKRGNEIYKELRKSQAVQLAATKAQADEGIDQAAEQIEFHTRKFRGVVKPVSMHIPKKR